MLKFTTNWGVIMGIRLKSLFLATIVAVNLTGCSFQDSNNFTNIEESSYEQILDHGSLQNRMISFIETIENSNAGINLSTFYNNAKTLQIITDKDKEIYYNSFYDKDKNVIVINMDELGAFEHELVHVIFNDGRELNNVFFEEGFTELLTSEICGNPNTYRFNVGLCKILTTLLGKDTIIETMNNKDLSIVINGLADIVPAEKDAEEYMSYANYQHILCDKMHQEFYKKGSLDDFKKTKEYTELKNVRSDLIGRIKIYVKAYYNKLVKEEEINPENTLTDMLAILDIVENELFDPDIEIEKKGDFFLKEEVDYLVSKYQINQETYDRCYKNSKTKKFIFKEDTIKKELQK